MPAPIVRASPRYQPPLAPLSEAREGTKDYKRSCKETNKQIPNRHTLSFIGRTAPPARLGSPGSAPPTRPPSSPSPTRAASFPSHAYTAEQRLITTLTIRISAAMFVLRALVMGKPGEPLFVHASLPQLLVHDGELIFWTLF